MFPGPDQCQQDAGTLSEGTLARDQSPGLLSCCICCATCHTPHTYSNIFAAPSTASSSTPTDLIWVTPPHLQVPHCNIPKMHTCQHVPHTIHSPHAHTHINNATRTILPIHTPTRATHFISHNAYTSQTQITTCHNDSTHAHHVLRYANAQKDIHKCAGHLPPHQSPVSEAHSGGHNCRRGGPCMYCSSPFFCSRSVSSTGPPSQSGALPRAAWQRPGHVLGSETDLELNPDSMNSSCAPGHVIYLC
jgi:hypothetical protein